MEFRSLSDKRSHKPSSAYPRQTYRMMFSKFVAAASRRRLVWDVNERPIGHVASKPGRRVQGDGAFTLSAFGCSEH
jgi:hypothetical protein